jgi:hypothetical protein
VGAAILGGSVAEGKLAEGKPAEGEADIPAAPGGSASASPLATSFTTSLTTLSGAVTDTESSAFAELKEPQFAPKTDVSAKTKRYLRVVLLIFFSLLKYYLPMPSFWAF